MNEELKNNILNILKQGQKAIIENDVVTLKNLSSQTLHSASVLQDEDSVSIAILMYALSKMFERTHYTEYKDWGVFYKTCLTSLKSAEENLAKDNLVVYQENIKDVLNLAERLESHLKLYMKEVLEKAKIHQASRLHEHGISVGKTAKILGITQWELMEYVGKTGIADVSFSVTKTAAERLKLTRGLFK